MYTVKFADSPRPIVAAVGLIETEKNGVITLTTKPVRQFPFWYPG
jgi:hypothetical protein